MEHDFWHNRWQTNHIGFHLNEVNPHLKKHAPYIIKNDDIVLVPLCGKSLDLLYLADHARNVIGIEISPLACESFFIDNHLTPRVKTVGKHTFYTHDNLTLICGDFFSLDRSNIPTATAIYDRAALIALPEHLRNHYIEKCVELSSPTAITLLITLEHLRVDDNGNPVAPPFSITPDKVNALFKRHNITYLETCKNLGKSGTETEHIFRLCP